MRKNWLTILAILVIVVCGYGIFSLLTKDKTTDDVNNTTANAPASAPAPAPAPQDFAYKIGDKVSFAAGGNCTKYIPNGSKGWSVQESAWTWTDGPEATLIFKISDTNNANLKLRLKTNAYLGGKLKEQVIGVYVNDQKVAEWKVAKDDWYEAPVSSKLANNGQLNVKFAIATPTSPKEAGESEDARKLGLHVEELVITKAN